MRIRYYLLACGILLVSLVLLPWYISLGLLCLGAIILPNKAPFLVLAFGADYFYTAGFIISPSFLGAPFAVPVFLLGTIIVSVFALIGRNRSTWGR